MPNVYEQVKQALQDVVAPEIKELRVEIRRLDEKIDSLDKRLNEKIDNKIDGLRAEMQSEFKRLDERIDSLEDKIVTALDFRERFAALEAKVAALSK